MAAEEAAAEVFPEAAQALAEAAVIFPEAVWEAAEDQVIAVWEVFTEYLMAVCITTDRQDR